MSQISGAWTAELDLGRLADQLALRLASVLVTEQLADRIAVKVAGLLTAPAGSDQYVRPEDPDPGARARRAGAGFGAVLENGTVEHDDGPTG